MTLIAFGIWTIIGYSQPEYPYLRSGDKSFEEGRYPDAETLYRKALEISPKANSSYNLANSMFLQDRIPEAIDAYKLAIQSAEKPEIKSKAYYNMGNAFFQNKEYQQSINVYKEALKINPSDKDAKKNLMLAMRQLRQEQEQKEQKKENKQPQQEEEQQDQKEQNKEEEQQQQQQQQQQEKEKNKEEDVSKEEAKEILKAIEREDQRVQEKLKKTQGKSVPPVKDW